MRNSVKLKSYCERKAAHIHRTSMYNIRTERQNVCELELGGSVGVRTMVARDRRGVIAVFGRVDDAAAGKVAATRWRR